LRKRCTYLDIDKELKKYVEVLNWPLAEAHISATDILDYKKGYGLEKMIQ